jgi:hypothetical protein
LNILQYWLYFILTKDQKHRRMARTCLDNAVAGAVMRHTAPMVANGTIDWVSHGPTDGRFFRHGEVQCPIAASGLRATDVLGGDDAEHGRDQTGTGAQGGRPQSA